MHCRDVRYRPRCPPGCMYDPETYEVHGSPNLNFPRTEEIRHTQLSVIFTLLKIRADKRTLSSITEEAKHRVSHFEETRPNSSLLRLVVQRLPHPSREIVVGCGT